MKEGLAELHAGRRVRCEIGGGGLLLLIGAGVRMWNPTALHFHLLLHEKAARVEDGQALCLPFRSRRADQSRWLCRWVKGKSRVVCKMAGEGGLRSAAAVRSPAAGSLWSLIALCLQPWGEGRGNKLLGPPLTALLHLVFLILNYPKPGYSPSS